MKKAMILYTDAGGGHKSAALAMQETILNGTDWDIDLVNPLNEWCSEFDLIKKFTSFAADDFYSQQIATKKRPLIFLLALSGIFLLNLAWNRKKIINKFIDKWISEKPDAVITVSPFINEIINESLKPMPNITFITLITDLKECFPKIWLVSERQHILCCSNIIKQQAIRRGISENKIFQLSGMLLRSSFYFIKNLDQINLRKVLGLEPDLLTGLIIFGGNGNPDMLDIARKINYFDKKIQIIFICGNNSNLFKKIDSLQVNYKKITLQFVTNVEQYMRCADFLIGKPGGISVAEAAILEIPQIIKLNYSTLLQERYNAQWVQDNKIGKTVVTFKNIDKDINDLLNNIDVYKRNLKKMHNKSLFETLVILENLVQRA